MALRSVRASAMMVAVLLAATAAAPPAKESDDFYASFTGFEDRVFNLEKSWKKLDQQLQKGAENMDLLHKKLDRLERLMSNRGEGTSEKLESRALHAQNAAERAASACNRLHHKLHTNSFSMQNTQTTNQGVREPSRVHHQSRDFTQQWPDHQKEKKDGGHAGEKRPIVMQQDATFSKEAFTISAKITNMYNELWRRSIIQEGLTKDAMALTNVTRKDTQDSLRSMMQLMRRSCSTMAQPVVQQCNVDQVIKLSSAMQHKMNDIDHKMYAKLDEVVMKQDSSRAAQDKELSELEDAIVNVLDRLSGAVLNKTAIIFNALQNIQEMLKNHNNHVATGITKINDAVHVSSKDLAKSISSMEGECRQQQDSGKNKELTEKLENVVMLLQTLQEQMSYSEEPEIEETNTINKEANEHHLQEESEVDNAKILESISLLCKNRSSEVNHVIEKLSHLIDKVQKSVTRLEERDDFFESENFERENKEDDIKLRHTKLINITTPTGLYEKLIHIANEPSYEDTSTDEDSDGDDSSFPNWEPRLDFEDERVELTTEGPTTRNSLRQNKRHKIFLTNNQIRGTHEADDPDEDGDT